MQHAPFSLHSPVAQRPSAASASAHALTPSPPTPPALLPPLLHATPPLPQLTAMSHTMLTIPNMYASTPYASTLSYAHSSGLASPSGGLFPYPPSGGYPSLQQQQGQLQAGGAQPFTMPFTSASLAPPHMFGAATGAPFALQVAASSGALSSHRSPRSPSVPLYPLASLAATPRASMAAVPTSSFDASVAASTFGLSFPLLQQQQAQIMQQQQQHQQQQVQIHLQQQQLVQQQQQLHMMHMQQLALKHEASALAAVAAAASPVAVAVPAAASPPASDAGSHPSSPSLSAVIPPLSLSAKSPTAQRVHVKFTAVPPPVIPTPPATGKRKGSPVQLTPVANKALVRTPRLVTKHSSSAVSSAGSSYLEVEAEEARSLSESHSSADEDAQAAPPPADAASEEEDDDDEEDDDEDDDDDPPVRRKTKVRRTNTASSSSAAARRRSGREDAPPSDQQSVIVCGIAGPTPTSERVWMEESDYFAQPVDVYTALDDPEQRTLYRASALAHKFHVATNQVGMYLVRRRHHAYVPGLYQALSFRDKPAGRTGLKAGGYFVSRAVCDEFGAYMAMHHKHHRQRLRIGRREGGRGPPRDLAPDERAAADARNATTLTPRPPTAPAPRAASTAASTPMSEEAPAASSSAAVQPTPRPPSSPAPVKAELADPEAGPASRMLLRLLRPPPPARSLCLMPTPAADASMADAPAAGMPAAGAPA